MSDSLTCPKCLEGVNKGASKCPHCSSELPSKSKAYGMIVLGILFTPVSLVALYLTISAVEIGNRLLLAMGLFELIIWGGFIGILVCFAIASPAAILRGIAERNMYVEMTTGGVANASEKTPEERGEEWAERITNTASQVSASAGQYSFRPAIPVPSVSFPAWLWPTKRLQSVKRFTYRAWRATWLWPVGVVLGISLWLAIWPTINNFTLFGITFLGGTVLLPLFVILDTRRVKRRIKTSYRWWFYVLLVCIPFIAPLFGVLWLYRRRQIVGSVFG